MSNNPQLPPPNMDDFEATMIREENPPTESLEFLKAKGLEEIHSHYESERAKIAKPRRAKPNNDIWTYIALGAWFAVAGFIGAFLGTVLANIL